MDSFSHDHYLDKKLLNELSKEAIHFQWKEHFLKRKSTFPNFKFIITNGLEIIHSDIPFLNQKPQSLRIKTNENVYFINIISSDLIQNHHFELLSNTIFIQEDISEQKSQSFIELKFLGTNEYYYLNHNTHEQLFYNNIKVCVFNELKSFFIKTQNKQVQKNKIIYNLFPKSILAHQSFSNIGNGQIQDDSIEVFHSEESKSSIEYNSLNSGKISTQINSVIGELSSNAETSQKISHIVLNEKSITNSKPNLMISNPNVVASHGNSIGNFSENDLFYLSQRGLTKEQSINILSFSKFNNIISKSSLSKELLEYYSKGVQHEQH